MAEDNEIKQKHRNIADLQNSMMNKDYKEVREFCGKVPEGPLQRISIYDDTVLHMAAHSKQEDLVLDLLKMISADLNHEHSNIKNTDGNSILHEVATSSALTDAAKELFLKDRNLTIVPNDLGEKPIFCAARYGQIKMFQILGKEMKLEKLSPQESKAHLKRNDGTTVLHISIAAESFGESFIYLFIYFIYKYILHFIHLPVLA